MKALRPEAMVRAGLCIGCGACVAQSGVPGARMRMDRDGLLRPAGPPGWSEDAVPRFERTCPFSPAADDEDRIAAELFPHAGLHDAATGRFAAAYVGHAGEGAFRAEGSSGGMATWLAAQLLREGMIDGVAHVHAVEDPGRDGRFFRYRISRDEDALKRGARSRYYPVEMSEVLRIIMDTPGRYAVVGIPCFIKAVQLMRREHPLLRERIRFTLGLFCGHMKSARFVESLAWQMGTTGRDVRGVEFRRKLPDRPASWYNAALALHDGRVLDRDWWHLADGDWGAGFFMDPACNFCDDVMAETADVSFGDAWVEPYASDWRGNNVVLVRSPEVARIVSRAIEDGRVKLDRVDASFVAQTQAAGLRQRREGLAYRLARRRGLRPRKRVVPDRRVPSAQRRLVYRMRCAISAGSHRAFRIARRLGIPALYIGWARVAAATYHALAYHRGRLGAWIRRLGLR